MKEKRLSTMVSNCVVDNRNKVEIVESKLGNATERGHNKIRSWLPINQEAHT